MELHELATLFPPLTDAELTQLSDDIKVNGQLQKITLLDGKILDGRNRYEACVIAGVEPEFAEYKGRNPMAFVVSQNLNRRHLSESQRAVIAEKMANMKRGGDRRSDQSANLPFEKSSKTLSKSEENSKVTIADAAKQMKVSPRSVKDVREIKTAKPRLIEDIAAGKKTIHEAKKEIAADKKPPMKAADLPEDERGRKLTPKLLPLWNRRDELKELMTALSKVKCRLEKAREDRDPLFAGITNLQSVAIGVANAFSSLSLALPVYVCPMCQGIGCKVCKETGLIGRFAFKTFVPRELKDAGES